MASPDALLAAHGPPPAPAAAETDPFGALDDLMAAIEMFCTTWPPREVSRRPWRCLI